MTGVAGEIRHTSGKYPSILHSKSCNNIHVAIHM